MTGRVTFDPDDLKAKFERREHEKILDSKTDVVIFIISMAELKHR